MLKLLSPFRYFLLENKEKQRIDLWPTVILSITLTVMFVFFDTANFFAPNGFMSGLAALTSSLTGFYVAALVAAATFNHPDLDVEIKYGPIYLDETDSDGIDKKRALTRRELICIIFGYLSCSALLFAVYANLGVSISHSVSVYLTNISSLSQKLTDMRNTAWADVIAA